KDFFHETEFFVPNDVYTHEHGSEKNRLTNYSWKKKLPKIQVCRQRAYEPRGEGSGENDKPQYRLNETGYQPRPVSYEPLDFSKPEAIEAAALTHFICLLRAADIPCSSLVVSSRIFLPV